MRALRSAALPLLTLAVATMGALATVRAPRDRVPSATTEPTVQAAPDRPRPDLSWLSIAAAEANPFRFERLPASPGYDVRREEPALVVEDPAPPPPPPPPRPEWTLTGILWGEAPVAVFEGIDGREGGRIVESGERLGDLLIAEIARDSVVVSQTDTAWVFKLIEPWKRGGHPS